MQHPDMIRALIITAFAFLAVPSSIEARSPHGGVVASVGCPQATSLPDGCDTIATSSSASISGSTLTVGGTITGTFAPGELVTGTGVSALSYVLPIGAAGTSGTGGSGTYALSSSTASFSGPITALSVAPSPTPASYNSGSDIFPAGTYQNAAFFSATCTAGQPLCARQSGQSYALASGATVPWNSNSHPPLSNVPAVDFPVGIDFTKVPGGALTVLGAGAAPAGCGTWSTSTNLLRCQTSTPGGIIINGYDFTGKGLILNNASGPCVIENSYFPYTSVNNQNTAAFIHVGSACAGGLYVLNNVYDGAPTHWGAAFTGTITGSGPYTLTVDPGSVNGTFSSIIAGCAGSSGFTGATACNGTAGQASLADSYAGHPGGIPTRGIFITSPVGAGTSWAVTGLTGTWNTEDRIFWTGGGGNAQAQGFIEVRTGVVMPAAIFMYNACFRPNGRCWQMGAIAPYVDRDNYIEGYIWNGGNHGELTYSGAASDMDDEYDVFLKRSDAIYGGQGMYAPYYNYFAAVSSTFSGKISGSQLTLTTALSGVQSPIGYTLVAAGNAAVQISAPYPTITGCVSGCSPIGSGSVLQLSSSPGSVSTAQAYTAEIPTNTLTVKNNVSINNVTVINGLNLSSFSGPGSASAMLNLSAGVLQPVLVLNYNHGRNYIDAVGAINCNNATWTYFINPPSSGGDIDMVSTRTATNLNVAQGYFSGGTGVIPTPPTYKCVSRDRPGRGRPSRREHARSRAVNIPAKHKLEGVH